MIRRLVASCLLYLAVFAQPVTVAQGGRPQDTWAQLQRQHPGVGLAVFVQSPDANGYYLGRREAVSLPPNWSPSLVTHEFAHALRTRAEDRYGPAPVRAAFWAWRGLPGSPPAWGFERPGNCVFLELFARAFVAAHWELGFAIDDAAEVCIPGAPPFRDREFGMRYFFGELGWPVPQLVWPSR